MNRQASLPATLALLAGLLASLLPAAASPARASEEVTSTNPVLTARIATLMAELARLCPLAAPGDQAAFDRCRTGLFHSSVLADAFVPTVLWGAPQGDVPIWRLHLTEFDARVFTGLYLPLFMFNGEYTLTRQDRDSWLRVHARTAFRSRLRPGDFPYPFWHTPEKWAAYAATNEILFRLDPAFGKIWVVLRVANPEASPVLFDAEPASPPPFDGKWLWTDEAGRTQPAVTLFDGLLSPGNPARGRIEAAYRDFATRLREQSCTSCHHPGNPQAMSPLVLLQTPAHAFGEIDRLMRAVENGRMPLEEWGAARPLAPAERDDFLAAARRFGATVREALDWERKSAQP